MSWLITASVEEAEELALISAEELLEDTRTPDEHELLKAYLRAVAPHGRVYLEVPIATVQGGRRRRIDAVRFPTRPGEIVQRSDFRRVAFEADLADGTLEIIEVKRTLNRGVFGQLLIARELAVDEWNLAPTVDLTAVALVGATDLALEPIFARHGLRVVHQA